MGNRRKYATDAERSAALSAKAKARWSEISPAERAKRTEPMHAARRAKESLAILDSIPGDLLVIEMEWPLKPEAPHVHAPKAEE